MTSQATFGDRCSAIKVSVRIPRHYVPVGGICHVRVDYRFAGFGTWATFGAPATAQGAWGQARGMDTPKRADEVRVAPTRQAEHRFDLKV